MVQGYQKSARKGYAKFKEGATRKGKGAKNTKRKPTGSLDDLLDAFATVRLGRQRKARVDKDARMLSETQALLSKHRDGHDNAPDADESEAVKKQKERAKQIREREAKKFHKLLNNGKKARRFPELVSIVESLVFEGFTTFAALLQVIFISIYMDCLSRNTLCADSPEKGQYCACSEEYQAGLSVFFIVSLPFFFFEWVLRLYVGQLQLLKDSVFWVDTLCTWISGIVFFYISVDGGAESHPRTWLLSLSVLRVIHVTNAIHLVAQKPLMKEVWLLVRGFSSSLRTLVCSAFLMVCTVYIFAILGTSTIGHSNRRSFVNPQAFIRAEAFDSLFTSSLTLFRCLFNDDAFELIEELHQELPHVFVYYYVYLATMSFVVMNLIIGVIVDNALEITSRDEEMIVHEVLMERRKLMQQLAEIFGELDSDGSGVVTFEEFITAFQIKEMRYMLQSLDFDEKDLIDLFQTLDDDNTGCLNLEEFLFGMSRLQGEPRAKDFLALLKLTEACAELAKYLGGQIAAGDEREETSAESAHSQDVLSRIATLRGKLAKTASVLKSMIAACKTAKLPPAVRKMNKRDDTNNANVREPTFVSLRNFDPLKEDVMPKDMQWRRSRATTKANETPSGEARTSNAGKGMKDLNLLDEGGVIDLAELLDKVEKKKG